MNQINIKGFFLPIILLCLCSATVAQRTATVSGNWNSTTTWGGLSVPTSATDVTINPNVAVTVTAAAACSNLTINGTLNLTSGSNNLTITNGSTVTVNDSVVFNSTARMLGGGNGGNGIMLVINTGATIQTARTGAFTVPGGNASGLNGFGMNSGNKTWTYAAGINWVFNGTTAQTTGAAITDIGDLTINNSAGVTLTNAAALSGTLTLTSGTFAAGTNLTLATNATIISGGGLMTVGSPAFGANAYDLIFTGVTRTAETVSSSGAGLRDVTVNLTNSAQTLSLGGGMTPDRHVTISTGTLNLASSGASVLGDLTIGSGTTLITNNNALNLSGNFVNSGNFTAGNSAITITGTATQSIAGFTTSSTGSLVFNKASGTATLTGAINSGSFTSAGSGTLELGSFAHTFSGNWTRTSGTINAGSGTVTIGGTVTNTAGTFNAGTGTVIYNGASAQTLATVTYNNLTLSGAGDKTTAGITVNGILSVEGSGLITDLPTYGSVATLRYNTSSPRSAGPEWETPFNADGGVIIDNTGAITLNAARRLNANLVINSGATLNTNDFAVRFQNDFVNDGTFNAGNSSIFFVGTLTQLVDGFTTTNDVVMNKNSGTVTVAGNINARDLDIQGTNGTIDFGNGFTHTFSRDWIRTEGNVTCGSSTIIFGRSVVGSTGTFNAGTGTVEWNRAGNQTVANVAYYNLTLSGSGTKSTDSILSVGNVLNVALGVVLNMGTHQLQGSSLTTSGTGLITTQAATSAIPSGRTWTMEVDYNASGAQTVIGGTYLNLTTSASGTKSATGNITVTSVLNVASGVVLSMGTNQLLGASLTTTGTGTLITGVTGTNALPNGRTWAMHVEYNATGNQLVASGIYQGNLTFDGPGISRTMQDDITVHGILALNSGTLVVNGPTEVDNNTLNIMSSVTDSGGTIDASSIDAHVNFGNTTPITIGDLFPTPIDILEISGGSTVTITADEQIGWLLNLSNGKLSIGDNVLSILGTISNFSKNNHLIGSKVSNLAIDGSGDMGDSLFFSQVGEGMYLNNFTINGDVTVHIGDTLKVRGTLTTENSTGEIKTNDYLTIASESTGSGRIYRVNPSFAFTGKVSVERYAKNKVARRYLFITTPVNDISIRDAWQDDIFITGPGSGGVPCGPGTGNGGVTDRYNINGFDETTLDLVSVYAYSQDSAARWFAPTNTSTLLKAGKGYRVLYRGPRGPNDAYCDTTINRQSVPMPDSTVMNVKGNIVTGNWTVTLDAKTSASPTALGYTLVGNPYACEISFALLKASNSAMAPTYYTYDPNGPTDTTGYLTVNNGVAAGYHSGGITPYPNPDAIASGQAFFVATDRTVDSVITFMESHKTLTNQPGVFRTSNAAQKIIRVHFSTAAGKLIDNTVIRFNNDPEVTTAENKFWDAVTFNSGNFIAAIKGTRSFAIQTRPLDFTYDTVMVRVVSATTGDFKLSFTDFANFSEAAEIWLLDAFTGTVHNVKADPFYSFTVTSNTATQGGRFKLAFRSLMSVMPMSFLNISASKKSQGVEVKWTVAQEQNILNYEVERSRNGNDFTTIGNVASKGNSITAVDYDFMDTNPLNGNAYYRIKSVEKGAVKYSSIVKVNSSAASPGFALYPNPVQNQLSISLPNGPDYNGANLTVRNVQGATVRSMSINGGTMYLDVSGFTNGIYFIVITTKDGRSAREKFIKY